MAEFERIIDGRLHVLYGGRWLPVPSGGDGPTEDSPEEPSASDVAEEPTEESETPEEEARVEVPEDLSGIEEGALRELHASLDEVRAAAREARDPDALQRAIDDQGRIVAEIERRRAERREIDERLNQLDEMESPHLPEPEPALAGANANAATLANVRERQSPTTPAQQEPPDPPVVTRFQPLLAAAGTEVVSAGSEMSLAQLGQAIERAKRGREGTTILASIPSFEEDEHRDGMPTLLSDRNGAVLNDELIHEAVEDWRARVYGTEPRQGSARLGAICQPFDIIRDIPDAFATSTPVADIFPSRPAGRGGFQFTPSGQLSDVTGGVNLWDETKQAAVDPNNSATWKPCVEYTCPPIQTAVLEAITQCVTFPITLEMSNPERVRNLNNAIGALRARTYEGRILQRIDQLSYAFVFSTDYGAVPAIIEAVNSLMPQLNWWNRQEPGNYTMILPPGVMEVFTMDRANRGYNPDEGGGATGDVQSYLMSNIEGVSRVVESMDASLGSEPGTFMDPLPTVLGQQAAAGAVPYLSGAVYRIRLVDPSAAIFAETGELNAGVLRDSNLIRQNRTGYFTEQFFFLAKQGPQPWATIDLHLCGDGARAGLVATNGCTKS